MNRIMSDKRMIACLVVPGLLVIFAGIVFPITMSVYLSLTDQQGGAAVEFIGLENYVQIFKADKTFWRSIFHSLLLAIGLICVQHPACILFAILLDKIGGRAEKVFRILLFIPCIISIMVTSKMWINILNPTFGMLNKILQAVGLSALCKNWLSDPNYVLWCIIFIVMWQGFGYGMLIYYAGVKGISSDINEACAIDGAQGWKKFLYVTFPLLIPVITVNVTLAIISALKEMEIIYLITDGGPGTCSQFVANYLYQIAFRNYQYGYANAISVVFVIICLFVTILYNMALKARDA
ncbi:MAG: sugar ABC transporter permease [Eubacteriales bacterium]|nr:sugar ABC transporter permease [Eubacteriales bacterium]